MLLKNFSSSKFSPLISDAECISYRIDLYRSRLCDNHLCWFMVLDARFPTTRKQFIGGGYQEYH